MPARICRPFRVIPVLSALRGVGQRTLFRQMVLADLKSGGRPLALDEEDAVLSGLFGLTAADRPDLLAHLDGHVPFEALVGTSAEGARTISARKGLASLALRPVALARFLDQMAARPERITTLWINARASRDGVISALAELGTEAVVVTTPDSDAMTASYQLAKRLSARQMMQLRILYNCATAEQGTRAHEGLADAAQRFIGLRIDCLGSVPFDPLLLREGAPPPGVSRRPLHLATAGGSRPAIERVLRELNRVTPPSSHATYANASTHSIASTVEPSNV
ncbi:MAG: hypothetical protein SF172_06320 [Burkholderiales bacterium]|nr:hypothetical protein [Burkholderiales bacterium]